MSLDALPTPGLADLLLFSPADQVVVQGAYDDIHAIVTDGPGAFVRQVVMTSPYFHDGSGLTLLDVLNHLDAGTAADPNHDPMVGTPLGLTYQEKAHLYAFLKALRSPPTIARRPTGRLCNDAAVEALRAALPR